MEPVLSLSRLAVALCACLLAGCAALSTTGRKVELVRSAPYGAKFVGTVAGSAPLAGWAFKNVSYEAAVNSALNQAGRLGATHLVLDPDSGPRFWGVGQSARGKAYRADRRATAATRSGGNRTAYLE